MNEHLSRATLKMKTVVEIRSLCRQKFGPSTWVVYTNKEDLISALIRCGTRCRLSITVLLRTAVLRTDS